MCLRRRVSLRIERASDKDPSQSYPDYLDLRDRNQSFDGLAAYTIPRWRWTRAKVRPVSGAWRRAVTTSTYYGSSRISAVSSTASDEHGPNSAPYIVLSYAYWHSHFHDDRGVVGRIVQVNKHPFTIVGVAPARLSRDLCLSLPISLCRW